MEVHIFTIFPEMFSGPLNTSIIQKAQEKGLINLHVVNFREYALTKHKNVDDSPYGGGAGMVIKPEPVFGAVLDNLGPVEKYDGKIILMSPQGKPFNQDTAKELVKEKKLAFICGHYEGFDERIRSFVDSEISIGDFVLTGGELPAMVVIDAVSRLIPGVLGEKTSAVTDSFYNDLLEHPHYTRPRSFRGMKVPDVLLSGNHENIEKWRHKQSLRRTLLRRPDIIRKTLLSPNDRKILAEIIKEENTNE